MTLTNNSDPHRVSQCRDHMNYKCERTYDQKLSVHAVAARLARTQSTGARSLPESSLARVRLLCAEMRALARLRYMPSVRVTTAGGSTLTRRVVIWRRYADRQRPIADSIERLKLAEMMCETHRSPKLPGAAHG